MKPGTILIIAIILFSITTTAIVIFHCFYKEKFKNSQLTKDPYHFPYQTINYKSSIYDKPPIYENPPIYDSEPDPYFRPIVPRNTLKYTSDKYRFKTAIASLDPEFADNMGYVSVDTPWDTVGMISTVDESDNTIMSLDKRALDPYREWYEYRVIDGKTGIVIPLGTGVTLLEDKDIIKSIPGKEGKGEYKVHLFDQNKYVYV